MSETITVSRRMVHAAWLAAVLGAAGLDAAANGQPTPLARRTAGLLVSDTTLDQVLLVRDLNGNGNAADPGEVTVFFDSGNASGLGAAAGNVFSIFQSCDGTVYIGDGDTDTVYALRDNNGDGDSQDAGEARVWFRSLVNAGGFPLETPNGIAADAQGRIVILNSGAAMADGVYRTVDLDGDGDANDAGEGVLWMDTQTLLAGSSAFDICLVGDAAYFADLLGGAPDAIVRARDADASGAIGAGEFGNFIADGNGYGVPCSFSAVTDGASIYVHESTSAVSPQLVYRLMDSNASNTVDQASEATPVWSEAGIPAGTSLANSFAIALGPVPPGAAHAQAAIISNGTDAQDAVFVMSDNNDDGDWLDAGETTQLIVGAAGTAFPENARQVMFYATPCRADFDRNCVANIGDIFYFLARWFALDPLTDLNGNGQDVGDIFLFLAIWFVGC